MRTSSLGLTAFFDVVCFCRLGCDCFQASFFDWRKMEFNDKFRQLEELLPTANDYRTASGAPGHKYWQQQVDYKMDVKIDPKTRKLEGEETITYHNNSPDSLYYLWLHIESASRTPDSQRTLSRSGLREP